MSILLAFAIENWGDEANQREKEQEILAALLDDFRSSRDTLKFWLGFHQASRDMTIELLQESIAGSQISEKEVDQYLSDLSWMDAEPHITTGALNSVIAGGELTLIRNIELRGSLADWPILIEGIKTVQQLGYAFYEGNWIPFLVKNTYFPQIANINSPMPGQPENVALGFGIEIADRVANSDLLKNEEFQSLLAWKTWIILDYINIYNVTNEKLNRTITLLEQELET